MKRGELQMVLNHYVPASNFCELQIHLEEKATRKKWKTIQIDSIKANFFNFFSSFLVWNSFYGKSDNLP